MSPALAEALWYNEPRVPKAPRLGRDPLEPGSASGQPHSALLGNVSLALPLGSLLHVHSERSGEGNHSVFKHCLMVKKNIWRTALPFTESSTSTSPNREQIQKEPLSSALGPALPVGATDQGTAGTQEPGEVAG